jgi:hypothetical protein
VQLRMNKYGDLGKAAPKMFEREPWFLYLSVVVIGVGCSSIFPAVATQIASRGYQGFKTATPHL